jgi:tRNA pseudouridine38/39 synthase
MKIAYLGWNHDGLASQQDSTNTIESHLFAALEKLKLVKDRSEAEYSRCGRTDKGVSAVCQIVSLLIRSKHPAGTDLTNDISSISDEMDYAHLLNRQLPPSIRVLGWQPVANDFDARFDCQYRQYKYYFPGNRFDLAAMQRAAQYLIGTHDFRNFCKIDFSKGDRQSFERTILHASVQVEQSSDDCGVSGMWSFNIRGTAFIWHQVRCTVALLFLVGRGLEQPEIIRDLLDIQRYPKKPDYKMVRILM